MAKSRKTAYFAAISCSIGYQHLQLSIRLQFVEIILHWLPTGRSGLVLTRRNQPTQNFRLQLQYDIRLVWLGNSVDRKLVIRR